MPCISDSTSLCRLLGFLRAEPSGQGGRAKWAGWQSSVDGGGGGVDTAARSSVCTGQTPAGPGAERILPSQQLPS